MKKIVRLTESDLVRLVKRVINEQLLPSPEIKKLQIHSALLEDLNKKGFKKTKPENDTLYERGNEKIIFKDCGAYGNMRMTGFSYFVNGVKKFEGCPDASDDFLFNKIK